MAAFSSNETVSITKTVEVKENELTLTPSESLDEVYELERCTSWIVDRDAKKVCLQFPDRLLGDSAEVALRLGKKLECKIYILGDTSYGSCCVDEVAAEHVDADAIIHFGHACLSPTKRLPVLYIFQKKLLDVDHFVSCFKNTYMDVSQRILLLYDVCYVDYIDSISAHISGEYENFVVSRLCTEPRSEATPHCGIKFGRVWNFHEGSTEEDAHVVFIGGDGRTLTNFALSLSDETVLAITQLVSTLLS